MWEVSSCGNRTTVFRNNLNQNCRVCDFSTHVGVKLYVNGKYITTCSKCLTKLSFDY